MMGMGLGQGSHVLNQAAQQAIRKDRASMMGLGQDSYVVKQARQALKQRGGGVCKHDARMMGFGQESFRHKLAPL